MGKWLFFAGWTCATLILGYSIYRDQMGDRLDATNSIGAIDLAKGTVQVKPDAKIIWREAYEGQLIGYNDAISTGPDGETVLNVRNAQPLVLGPNSIITLRTKGKDQRDVVIDLARGFLQTKSDPIKANASIASQPGGKIEIKSGTEVYTINSQSSEIVLLKESRDATTRVLKATGDIKDSQQKSILIEGPGAESSIDFYLRDKQQPRFEIELDKSGLKGMNSAMLLVDPQKASQLLDLKPLEEPKVEEADSSKEQPKEPDKAAAFLVESSKLKSDEYIPTIVSPISGQIGWVAAPFAKIKSMSLPVSIKPPDKALLDNYKWTPFIGGGSSGALAALASASQTWQGQPSYVSQQVPVHLSSAQNIISESHAPFDELSLSIRPGAILEHQSMSIPERVMGESQIIRLRSLQSLNTEVVKLCVQKWDFNAPPREISWSSQGGCPSGIVLKSKSDLPKLKGLMNDGGFQVMPSAWTESTAVYLVRNNNVIARVEGVLGTLANLNQLKNALGANFMFRGTASDYLGGGKTYAEVADQFKGEKIYVLNGGKFIGVNQEFVSKNKAVQEFLNSGNATFFRAPIQRLGEFTPSGVQE